MQLVTVRHRVGASCQAKQGAAQRWMGNAQPAPRRNVVARGGDPMNTMFGENFGARDPTAGEIESNFSDKVLYNWDTFHLTKPPEKIKQFVGLTSRNCAPADRLTAVSDKDVETLRQQVPGWRVTATKDGKQCIRQDWKLKDAAAVATLTAAVQSISAEQGHPAAAANVGNEFYVELTSPSVGALTENDFIVASRINQINVKDLLATRKAKYWA